MRNIAIATYVKRSRQLTLLDHAKQHPMVLVQHVRHADRGALALDASVLNRAVTNKGSTKLCPECLETHWRCCTCKEAKPISEFAKNNATATGLHNECRPCHKETSYRKLYGLAFGEYAKMLSAQAGVCAICKQPPTESKPLHVDHDHSTGTVRKLLCHFCNIGLGHFREDPELLFAAIDYVFEHSPTIKDEDRNVRVPE